MKTSRLAILALLLCLTAPAVARAGEPSPADAYMSTGRISEGVKTLTERVKATPTDQALRYNLGLLQFVRAVERLGQSLYRYGLMSDLGRELGMPVLRLPLPPNPSPEELDYTTLRRIAQAFIDDLRAAQATLAAVDDPTVKVPVRLGLVRLDLDGTGKAALPLRKLLAQFLGGESSLPRDREMAVAFDLADVYWLRGYCHLLCAQAETVMAYGGQDLFDHTAQLFFARPKTPYPFLRRGARKGTRRMFDSMDEVVDIVTFVHLLRLPMKETPRMRTALADLKETIAMSRRCWQTALAETDDDREWLPNPKQHGMIGVRVTSEMIEAWLAFMSELEALLDGRRLVPFWRSGDNRGVNLRRVFTEPRSFDLVLWVQGTAPVPYLEEGQLTRKEVWNQLWRVFQGNFMGFAIWFN